jgi:hypothetical protein
MTSLPEPAATSMDNAHRTDRQPYRIPRYTMMKSVPLERVRGHRGRPQSLIPIIIITTFHRSAYIGVSRLLPGQDGAFISILPSVGKRRSCRRSESSCVIFSPSCLFCCRRIENALFLYQSVRELFTNIVTPAAADPGMFDLETDSDWVLITDPHQNQPSSLIKDCSKRAPNRRHLPRWRHRQLQHLSRV